jgi:hypothetical protein
LGHVVNVEASHPNPKKIVVVKIFPILKFVTNVRAFLRLTNSYRKFIPGYAKIVEPLFGLTKKDDKFLWTPIYQGGFITLKNQLATSLVLKRSNFSQPFILDVHWFIKGMGAILSQKFKRQEQVIAYANKGLSPMQKSFHPMEGECYALGWGIMHFYQYLHQIFFLLKTDHKPLEWLAIVLDAYGCRTRWISMLHDFHFKIIQRAVQLNMPMWML